MPDKEKKGCNRGVANHIGERSDEWYTREEDVERIVPYIREHMRGKDKPILCPFDCAESAFVKVLTRNGFNVVYGDLLHDGKDFFKDWDFNEYALIISNPPFSLSNNIVRTLLNAGTPFCLLTRYDGMICARANYAAVKKNKDTMSLMLVCGKLKFTRPDGTMNGTPYYISWVCNKFNREQCIFLD